MNRDDIIRMARESCDKDKVDAFHNDFWTITQEELERFAELVVAASEEQRKQAAKRESHRTQAKGEKFMKKYYNRYGNCYYYKHYQNNLWEFILEGKDSMGWCRYGGKDGETEINVEDLGMFDPAGGPFISIGTILPIGQVKKIIGGGKRILLEVE